MLDEYFTRTSQLMRIRERASATTKTVKTSRDRLVRKLVSQQAELEETVDRDRLRECGDIITANLHLMKKGQQVLTAQDFYSEDGGMREIALDPLKTPQQNAAKYYKDYTKAKNAEKILSQQIMLGRNELEYLDSVLQEIEYADGARDLGEIRSELIQTGYIKPQKNTKEKPTESEPMKFISSNGMRILAGKNNIQNDKLTLKTASKHDIWFHAQKIHGAHVILVCDNAPPDETSLYEAASIAAYYSSARSGGKVPVDYTLVKYVKKPSGGRPGMVIYTDYKTMIAIPDAQLVIRNSEFGIRNSGRGNGEH
jgi:predicted ribosome quality control (RQC) complex YloA/Tae2 family protein